MIGKPDADGGCFVRAYFPAATSALLEAALAPARNPGYASPKRGRSELDPHTGRYGYRPPRNFYNPDPQIELNNTTGQHRSAGAKIRRQ